MSSRQNQNTPNRRGLWEVTLDRLLTVNQLTDCLKDILENGSDQRLKDVCPEDINVLIINRHIIRESESLGKDDADNLLLIRDDDKIAIANDASFRGLHVAARILHQIISSNPAWARYRATSPCYSPSSPSYSAISESDDGAAQNGPQ